MHPTLLDVVKQLREIGAITVEIDPARCAVTRVEFDRVSEDLPELKEEPQEFSAVEKAALRLAGASK